MKRSYVAVLGAIALAAGMARANITDTMDSTANFDSPFGGETVTANGDGTVTILRNNAGVDAGINWQPGGQNIPIAGNELLTITPVAAVSGGYWVPTILLFDSGGNFLGEKPWLGDTNTTAPQTLNIPDFATSKGVSGAAQYYLRLRMDPFNNAGSGFTFTEIDTTAIPEPASVGLIGAGALALLRRPRVRSV